MPNHKLPLMPCPVCNGADWLPVAATSQGAQLRCANPACGKEKLTKGYAAVELCRLAGMVYVSPGKGRRVYTTEAPQTVDEKQAEERRKVIRDATEAYRKRKAEEAEAARVGANKRRQAVARKLTPDRLAELLRELLAKTPEPRDPREIKGGVIEDMFGTEAVKYLRQGHIVAISRDLARQLVEALERPTVGREAE